jgi:hypothetical protein
LAASLPGLGVFAPGVGFLGDVFPDGFGAIFDAQQPHDAHCERGDALAMGSQKQHGSSFGKSVFQLFAAPFRAAPRTGSGTYPERGNG